MEALEAARRVALLVLLALAPLSAAVALPTDDVVGDIVLVEETTTPGYLHLRYEQRVDGVRVADAVLRVHEPRADTGQPLAHDALVRGLKPRGAFLLPEGAARALAVAAAGATQAETRVERVWAPRADGLVAAYEVDVVSLVPPIAARVRLDAETGAVLSLEDRRLAADVPARVFRVSPLVGAQASALRDNPAAVDDPAFAEAYVDVTLANVTGLRLENERLVVLDSAPALEALSHGLRRDDPRLLEAMVYYYVEDAYATMDALGYGDVVTSRVRVLSHMPYPIFDGYAMSRDLILLSWRAGVTQGSAAEDAEFVVHEFGHIYHLHANPDVRGEWFTTFGEGTADLYAALMLEPHSGGFGDSCIFDWTATKYPSLAFEHGELVCLRVLDNDFVVGDDQFDTSYGHHHAQYWTGAVWDARQTLGRNATLALLLEATYLVPPEPSSFEDIAAAWLAADEALHGGANAATLRAAFAAHGIVVPGGNETLAPAAVPEEAGKETPAAGLAVATAGALAGAWVSRRKR